MMTKQVTLKKVRSAYVLTICGELYYRNGREVIGISDDGLTAEVTVLSNPTEAKRRHDVLPSQNR